ncbi:MAG: hypothetical protein C0501_02480 [Isosphaera sp.]|nr:hypothetical protein [Isosphaera sp.]
MHLALGTQVWLACRPTDMRKGFDSLATHVKEVLRADPFSGHLFMFRGKRGDYLKLLYWDGSGLCLLPSQPGHPRAKAFLPCPAFSTHASRGIDVSVFPTIFLPPLFQPRKWPFSRDTTDAVGSVKLPRPLSTSGSLRPFA